MTLAATQPSVSHLVYILPFAGTLITAAVGYLAVRSGRQQSAERLAWEAAQRESSERQERERLETERRKEEAERLEAAVQAACADCEERVRSLTYELSLMTDRLYAAHERIGAQSNENKLITAELTKLRTAHQTLSDELKECRDRHR